MINLLFTNPILFVLWGVSLVTAVTIHEFAHAWTADRLGDPTPRSLNRVTLNPLSHLDPTGTIAMLIAGIGWGKPVPFDPYNLENPRRDTLLIALAGPASNILLAVGLSLVASFFPVVTLFVIPMITLNVGLAIFNLVPIAPLDGSKILMSLLPPDQAVDFEQFGNRYGMWLLLFLIIPIGGSSLVGTIISPMIQWVVESLIELAFLVTYSSSLLHL